MSIRVKRVYDPPSPEDVARILVDRLWPRGLTKEAVALDDWAKDVAPSNGLRRWFHAHPDQWGEFCARYAKELESPQAQKAMESLKAREKKGRVTLLFAARDAERNNATALKRILEEGGGAA